jgi:hypothetical protein
VKHNDWVVTDGESPQYPRVSLKFEAVMVFTGTFL